MWVLLDPFLKFTQAMGKNSGVKSPRKNDGGECQMRFAFVSPPMPRSPGGIQEEGITYIFQEMLLICSKQDLHMRLPL